MAIVARDNFYLFYLFYSFCLFLYIGFYVTWILTWKLYGLVVILEINWHRFLKAKTLLCINVFRKEKIYLFLTYRKYTYNGARSIYLDKIKNEKKKYLNKSNHMEIFNSLLQPKTLDVICLLFSASHGYYGFAIQNIMEKQRQFDFKLRILNYYYIFTSDTAVRNLFKNQSIL